MSEVTLTETALPPCEPPWWTAEDERIAETYVGWSNRLEKVLEADLEAWNCRICFHWESEDGMVGRCHAGMETDDYADCPEPPVPSNADDTCEMFYPNGPRRMTRFMGAEHPDVAARLTEAQRTKYVLSDWRAR